VKNLDDAIDLAKTGNLILHKFICFSSHEDNPIIGFSDKDQELLEKLTIPNFMEKEKSKSPSPPLNPSRSSTNYKKPAMEIHPVDID
jgi:hypothetical protein